MNQAARQRVAVAIIEEDGRILIARRKADGLFPNLWELPGGKCGDNEDPAECVVREVREETGLTVAAAGPAVVLEHAYPEFTLEIHAYSCRVTAGEARPLESQAITWIAWDEIDNYQFPEANKKVFAQANRQRTTKTERH